MCTAISITLKDNYFGRTLDYEQSFGEKITITPRNYCFKFTNGEVLKTHYAIIGMAVVHENYPLYFDATNEMGLSAAGLNFPDYAVYRKRADNKENIASFEFIAWVLSRVCSIDEAKKAIEEINITDAAFCEKLPPSPLHWLISDKSKSITVEQTESGLKVYENTVGVLTNSPPFDYQMTNLVNFLSITSKTPQNEFSDKIDLMPYSRGMGAIGLPGDYSSASRFVRACFVKLNCVFETKEQEIINQFFYILHSVYLNKGYVSVGEAFAVTNYISCCNTDKGIYYYTTYNRNRINAVDMHRENLESNNLIQYELLKSDDIIIVNKKY